MNATSKGFWPHFQWKGMCKISTKKYITIWPKPFWGRIYSSNQGHFLVCCSFRFSFFWSKWPKSNKSAILFVYFLYKNPHFAWKWQLIDQKMKKKMNPTLDCFWSFRNRLMNGCEFRRVLAPCQWKEMCKIPTKNTSKFDQNLSEVAFIQAIQYALLLFFGIFLDCVWSFRNRLMNECDFKRVLVSFSRHLQNRLFLK